MLSSGSIRVTHPNVTRVANELNHNEITTVESLPILPFLPLGNYCAATIIFRGLFESIARYLDTVYENSYVMRLEKRYNCAVFNN